MNDSSMDAPGKGSGRRRISTVFMTILIVSLFIYLFYGLRGGIGGQFPSIWVKADNQPATNTMHGILDEIHMIDATVGWASSWYDSGNAKRYTILRTTDAGGHWKVMLTCTPFLDRSQGKGAGFESCLSDFHSALVASVLEPEQNHQSRIFHTSDGGLTWQSTLINGQHMIANPVFVDAQHGWVLVTDNFPGFDLSSLFIGQQIALYRTTDGGQTWQRILSGNAHGSGDAFGTAPLIHDAHITFSDASTGWLTGTSYNNDNTSTSWLYVTHDGGAIWHRVAVSFPAQSLIMWSPRFFTPQNGLLPVLTSGPAPQYAHGTLFYVTHDGGRTWTPGVSLPFDVTNSEFMDMNHGWAFMDTMADKTFYTTGDGWQHWTSGHMDTSLKRIYGFTFISPNAGWALGTNAIASAPEPGGGLQTGDVIAVLKTIDGGQTWREIAHSNV
jgi:photosystem II stability/assembly factor-like uncharacterized protein